MAEMYALKSHVAGINAEPESNMYRLPSYHAAVQQSAAKSNGDHLGGAPLQPALSIATSSDLAAKEEELIQKLRQFNLKLDALLEHKPEQSKPEAKEGGGKKNKKPKDEPKAEAKPKADAKPQPKGEPKKEEKRADGKAEQKPKGKAEKKTDDPASSTHQPAPPQTSEQPKAAAPTDWKAVAANFKSGALSGEQLVRQLCRHLASQDFVESKKEASPLDRELVDQIVQLDVYLPNNVELWARRVNGEKC
ncbi:hypothetical protein M3Y99_01684600 [Aphelenchoides fujianensis]|nr:hypothetical protein M3Y99_01684600 [Aphelenchoides fujianensis]